MASRVALRPTPPAISSYFVATWSRVAAPSAGIDRKNDRRVTVTRSSPRSRPADIVAPERDTPGISARHWVMPMMIVSLRVTSASCRVWVACESA